METSVERINMNHFCEFCVGGKTKDSIKDIEYCEYPDCPFYNNRYADITHEDDVEISKKLLGEMGVTK